MSFFPKILPILLCRSRNRDVELLMMALVISFVELNLDAESRVIIL